MKYLSEKQKELAGSLKEIGFIKRGNSYFRLIGDGVLETVKIEYEPHEGAHYLRFGLTSMYSDLLDTYFVPMGCVCSYNSMSFAGKGIQKITRWIKDNGKYLPQEVTSPEDLLAIRQFQGVKMYAESPLPDGMGKRKVCWIFNGKNYISREPFSLEEQIVVLREYGVPILNRILNQNQLVSAMCHFDTVEMGHVDMLDLGKFAPYLVTEEYGKASEIVSSIIIQNKEAMEANAQYGIETDIHSFHGLEYMERILTMVEESNQSNISRWLEENYLRNMSFYQKYILKM